MLCVSITNIGFNDVSTNSLYAHLKDKQNYLYESEIALSPIRLQLVDLPANQTIRGELYFEIPAGAEIVSFLWSDWNSNILIPEFPSAALLGFVIVLSSMAIIGGSRLKNRRALNKITKKRQTLA